MSQRRRPAAGRNMRLADQIRKDLASIVQREFDVARIGLVTLTEVELTTDFAHAKVYFTVMGAEPDVATAALNDKAGWLHSQLYRLFHIHTVPTLRFLHDERLLQGLALSRLIDEANRASDADPAADPDDDDPDDRP